MCTAITLKTLQNDMFFGRSMDFSYPIEPHLYIMPKQYQWINIIDNKPIQNKYRFIAIGEEKDGLLGFFDGVNEKGFAAATLFFAGYASYSNQLEYSGKVEIASIDFLHYILGQCSCIEDLVDLLYTIALIGIPDPITRMVAPLHWIATDQSGKCVVIEQTRKGLLLYNNPIGVLTNSPDFPWHITNLRNYMEASPYQTNEVIWGNMKLRPFGQGGGSIPLPGGYTSPERFVRTAFRKSHIPTPANGTQGVISCFHILDAVTIPEGCVITDRETFDYTKYVAIINTSKCQYYFKTYENIQIATVGLFDYNPDTLEIKRLGSLSRPVQFQRI